MNQHNEESEGCGCISLVLTIFLITAWISGVPTPWGKFSFDLFPPAIHMNGK